MEEQRSGIGLGGILRFLLGLVIVVIVAFLLVRFITNRHDKTDSSPTTQQATQKNNGNDQQKNSGNTSSDSENTSADNKEDETVPSGVADDQPSTPSRSVPAAGMSSDVWYAAALFACLTIIIGEMVQFVHNKR